MGYQGCILSVVSVKQQFIFNLFYQCAWKNEIEKCQELIVRNLWVTWKQCVERKKEQLQLTHGLRRKLTLYKLQQALLCILNAEGNIPNQRRGIILLRQILQATNQINQLEDFRRNCFLCARFVTDTEKQSGKVHMVQCKSKEVDRGMADAILRRQNDEWSLEVKGQRMLFITEIATAVFDLARENLEQILRFHLGNVGGQQ